MRRIFNNKKDQRIPKESLQTLNNKKHRTFKEPQVITEEESINNK